MSHILTLLLFLTQLQHEILPCQLAQTVVRQGRVATEVASDDNELVFKLVFIFGLQLAFQLHHLVLAFAIAGLIAAAQEIGKR